MYLIPGVGGVHVAGQMLLPGGGVNLLDKVEYKTASDTASLTITDSASVVATTVETPSGGWGWFNRADAERARRISDRRKRKEDDEEVESIPDAIDREIAALLREQEAKDAERAELERLRSLARSYDGGDIDARFARALDKAANARTLAAARMLDMEVARIREEEEFLMTALLAVIDD